MGFNFSHRQRTSAKTVASLQGRLKLAGLFAMSEEEYARTLREMETSERFTLLKETGVLAVKEFSRARFNARNFAGYGLRTDAGGLPELADGDCDYVRLIQKVGQEKFEALFLKEDSLSDPERAKKCGISAAEAKKIREFMNRVFIQAEFEDKTPALPPAAVYSAVAGIEIEDGKPVIAFFHREIWKGRYGVNKKKLEMYLSGVPDREAAATRTLLRRVEFLEQRKTTLYAALEKLIAAQSFYLLTGKPVKRSSYTQRALAAELGVCASVINRMVSNKSVQLPWGMEAPMEELLPSEKKINKEKLYTLIQENPDAADLELTRLLHAAGGKKISRRSITQYRKELETKN
jgi:hypothetical protein